jgi:hypothetical protein
MYFTQELGFDWKSETQIGKESQYDLRGEVLEIMLTRLFSSIEYCGKLHSIPKKGRFVYQLTGVSFKSTGLDLYSLQEKQIYLNSIPANLCKILSYDLSNR